MQAIRALCRRCVLLNNGQIVSDGQPAEIIDGYNKLLKSAEVNAHTAVGNEQVRRGSGAVRFSNIEVQDASKLRRSSFEMGETIRFALSYHVFERVHNLSISVAVRAGQSRELITSTRHPVSGQLLSPGENGVVTIEWPDCQFRPGEYVLYFWLGDRYDRPYDVVDDLTAPLTINTHKSFEELGFDPTRPAGYFNIESHLLDAILKDQS